MSLGTSKYLKKALIRYNLIRFNLKKKLFGFETANIMTRWLDKESLKYILIKNGAKIGENCDIESGPTFHNCKDYSNLTIGDNCHIGKNCFFDLKDQVVIENNVVISMECIFITHIDMNRSVLKKLYPAKKGKIFIKDNTYIAANVTLLMNTTLQSNSFIAAGAVVNKKINSNTMAGGIPAKEIKYL